MFAIGGFPLCDNNYAHSVALLKERFGQQHKLVDAHMEAILHVSTPSNNLSSLQNFYGTIQNHIKALAALGTPPETYGPMLIAIILRKLLSDVKSHMARDHYDSEWTPNTLLDSILKEIRSWSTLREVHNHSNKFFNNCRIISHALPEDLSF